MRDIVYFRARWPELDDDPSGAAIADVLAKAIAARDIEVGPIRPHYDGWVFPATRGRQRNLVEVTPYFEAQPIEWSIQVRPVGILSKWFGARARIALFRACEAVLGADCRVHDVRWMRLADLARRTTVDESPTFTEL